MLFRGCGMHLIARDNFLWSSWASRDMSGGPNGLKGRSRRVRGTTNFLVDLIPTLVGDLTGASCSTLIPPTSTHSGLVNPIRSARTLLLQPRRRSILRVSKHCQLQSIVLYTMLRWQTSLAMYKHPSTDNPRRYVGHHSPDPPFAQRRRSRDPVRPMNHGCRNTLAWLEPRN